MFSCILNVLSQAKYFHEPWCRVPSSQDQRKRRLPAVTDAVTAWQHLPELFPRAGHRAHASLGLNEVEQLCEVVPRAGRTRHVVHRTSSVVGPQNTALSCKRRIDEAREARIEPPLVSCSDEMDSSCDFIGIGVPKSQLA